MNKKIILIISLILLFSFGGVVGALTYHVTDRGETLKSEYAEEITERVEFQHIQLRNDVMDMSQREIERLETTTRKYLEEKLAEHYIGKVNEEADAIKEETDRLIQEIKDFIDDSILNAE